MCVSVCVCVIGELFSRILRVGNSLCKSELRIISASSFQFSNCTGLVNWIECWPVIAAFDMGIGENLYSAVTTVV